jgi:hypothetical protein
LPDVLRLRGFIIEWPPVARSLAFDRYFLARMINTMPHSSSMDRRRFICMALTAAVVVSLPLSGCGGSGDPGKLSPEAQKALMVRKIGVEDPALLPKTADNSKVKKRP